MYAAKEDRILQFEVRRVHDEWLTKEKRFLTPMPIIWNEYTLVSVYCNYRLL